MGNRHHVHQAIRLLPEVHEKDARGIRELLGGGFNFSDDIVKAVIGESQCTCRDAAPSIRKIIAMIAPQLPDGVEWPRFEDGSFVTSGDEVFTTWGDAPTAMKVEMIGFTPWEVELHDMTRCLPERVEHGDRVKRPHDSWEQLVLDAQETARAYYAERRSIDGILYNSNWSDGVCSSRMQQDLVLRAKALAGEGE